MLRVVTVMMVLVVMASCSIMILNHSDGNKLRETTDPQTEIPVEVMGRGNSMEVRDSLK